MHVWNNLVSSYFEKLAWRKKTVINKRQKYRNTKDSKLK